MLKQTASIVLNSLRGSRLRRNAADIGSTGGYFPFVKIHCMGERLHKCGTYLLASSLAAALLDGLPFRANLLGICGGGNQLIGAG